MTSTRPRLVILKGSVALDPTQVQQLKSVFDVVEVHTPEAAKKMLDGAVGGVVICAPGEHLTIGGERLPTGAATILERIGDGIGVVDSTGSVLWTDARFKVHDEHVRNEFVRLCRTAMEQFNLPAAQAGANRRHARRYAFPSDGSHYELVVCPSSLDQQQDRVMTVVGVLWDVTANQTFQEKIRKIEAAGTSLLRIDSASLNRMNMADRLKALEQKICAAMHEVLQFDNFEVRLLDRESGQLELVIAQNIAPLKVGEVLFARSEGNGISGYVAATGQSYVCPNVQHDPKYREGLENAGSSLTVPLMLDDRVIGTLNIESCTPNTFDDNDRRLAEAFGRSIALAMNVLDLLVIERFTTNEQAAANILGELKNPLTDLANQVQSLRTTRNDDLGIQTAADQLQHTLDRLQDRLHACASGPRTILGAEQELHRHELDPLLVGKRILIADDEPAIRETLNAILTQKGAIVTMCDTGGKTIEALEAAGRVPGAFFDMVISDIKMPDRNGYEVYRTAKSLNADIPVVLMTGFGYDPHHSIVRASQEGLQSFLFKPFKVSQLMEVVSRSLAKR